GIQPVVGEFSKYSISSMSTCAAGSVLITCADRSGDNRPRQPATRAAAETARSPGARGRTAGKRDVMQPAMRSADLRVGERARQGGGGCLHVAQQVRHDGITGAALEPG